VFFSDNGGPQPGDPSVNGSRNWPFRGGKAQYFDGGIHVPMFIKMPGVLTPGSHYDKAVSSLDLVPTLLAAVGKAPLKDVPLDGVNLMPCLTGANANAPHDRLYWRTGAGFALIDGDWKIVWPRRENGLPENPERPDLTRTELYHLSGDKAEKTNLASQDSQRLSTMLSVWQKWDSELASPLWGTWKQKPATTQEKGE
jgi:arylsulfatase A-like enzyme